MTEEFLTAIRDVVACLKKYQGRYHESEHAKKDWNRSKTALDNLEQLMPK